MFFTFFNVLYLCKGVIHLTGEGSMDITGSAGFCLFLCKVEHFMQFCHIYMVQKKDALVRTSLVNANS